MSALKKLEQVYGSDAVAVLGAGCRFPAGIADADDFFKALIRSADLITEIPEDRFDVKRFVHPNRSLKGHSVTFNAGVMGEVKAFDHSFFGMSVSEAASLDPQQRVALEMSYEALENAGIRPSLLTRSKTAVVMGAASTDMAISRADDAEAIGPYSMTGTNLSIISNRLSYFYDLSGPSLTVDTACSSSLVAIHTACEFLRHGEAQLALAGGVNILLSPLPFIGFSQAHMLSASGHCQVFCESADGYVRAEGGAVVVLKRLDAALRDGDRIQAVITASKVNSDGRTQGIALPNEKAQQELLESIYGRPETAFENLVYVEAHGTGTKAGDPLECEAIGKALGSHVSHPLLIGSVKANTGHLETASGAAGLIKALEILKEGVIPGQKLYGPLNQRIDFKRLNLAISEEAQPVAATPGPALIGINSFGFGGTNAHVVLAAFDEKFLADAALQETQEPESGKNGSNNHVPYEILLSAKTPGALKTLAGRYAAILTADNLRQTAAAAAYERELYPWRLLAESADPEALIAGLKNYAAGKGGESLAGSYGMQHSDLIDADRTNHVLAKVRFTEGAAVRSPAQPGKLALVFSGNGAQYAGMACDLYAHNEVFRRAFDEVSRKLLTYQELSLSQMMAEDPQSWDLARPEVAQIFIFAIEAALTCVLKEAGLEAQIFLGHSVGEVAAAWAAGRLSLDDACRVIVKRSYCQAKTSQAGAMAAVRCKEALLRQILGEPEFAAVEIAGFNAAESFTLSGPRTALEALCARLKDLHLAASMLKLSYAFHSAFMEPIEDELKAALDELAPLPPEEGKTFISTVSAESSGSCLDADYWWQNIRRPVLFEKAVKKALSLGADYFVEVGPRAILKSYLKEIVKESGTEVQVLSLLSRGHEGADDLSGEIARLRLALTAYDELRAQYRGRPKCALPTYPFERKMCWTPSTAECQGLFAKGEGVLIGRRLAGNHWRSLLDDKAGFCLEDHCVGEQVLMPFMGFLEMGLELAQHSGEFKNRDLLALNFSVTKALSLDEGLMVVESVLGADGDLKISARPHLSSEKTLSEQVSGRLLPCEFDPPRLGLYELKAALPVRLDAEKLYDDLAASGLNYGPGFKAISEIWADESRVLVRAVLKNERRDGLSFELGAWDAALQAVFVLLYREAERCQAGEAAKLYLPSSVKRLWLKRDLRGSGSLYAFLENYEHEGESLRFDVKVCDSEGRVKALFEEITFKAVSRREAPAFYEERLVALDFEPKLSAALKAALPAFAGELADSELRYQRPQKIAALKTALLCALILKEVRSDLPLGEFLDPEEFFNVLLDDEAGLRTSFAFEILRAAGLAAKNDEGQYAILESSVLGLDCTALGQALLEADPEHFALYYPLLSRGLNLKERAGERLLEPLSLLETPKACEVISKIADFIKEQAVEHEAQGAAFRVLFVGSAAVKLIAALKPLIFEGRIRIVLTVENEREQAAAASYLQELAILRLPVVRADEFSGCACSIPFSFAVCAPEGLPILKQIAKAQAFVQEELAFLSLGMPADDFYLLSMSSGELKDYLAHAPEQHEQTSCRGAGILQDSFFEASDDDFILTAGCMKFGKTAGDSAAETAVQQEPGQDEPARKAAGVKLVPAVLECPEGLRNADPDAWQVGDLRTLDKEPLAQGALKLTAWCRALAISGEPAGTAVQGIKERQLGAQLKVILVSSDTAAGEAQRALIRTLVREYRLTAVLSLTVSETQLSALKAASQLLSHLRPEMAGNSRPLVPLSEAGRNGRGALELGRGYQEYVLREGHLFERELAKVNLSAASASETETADKDFEGLCASCLTAVKPGRLSSLAWQERIITECPAASDEVDIEIRAAGINFRDVMWASGLLPSEALRAGFSGVGLGLEAAGVVINAGEKAQASGIKAGDRVIALAPHALSSRVRTKAHAVFNLPEGLSFAEGASLSVVYFTAYWAIVEKARAQRGQSILIHGAAGGVGLAAINIAKDLGLEIYATAGSEAKRNYLKLLGVDHVYSSRDLNFGFEVLRDSRGRGADIVLNSLYDRQAALSFELTASGGSFIELGKRDFYEDHLLHLKHFKDNVAYFGVDADEIFARQPQKACEVMQIIVGKLKAGAYRPLPVTALSSTEAAAAFARMRRALHVGKIVLVQHKEKRSPCNTAKGCFNLKGDLKDRGRLFVVSGATGGLGSALCRYLLQSGASQVLALGRRHGALPDDPRLSFVHCDFNEPNFAEELLCALEERLGSRSGGLKITLIHAAGVLRDGNAHELACEDYCAAARVKAEAAQRLYGLFKLFGRVDSFLGISSVTVLFGNPGQAAYVEANALLEAFVKDLRKQGVRAAALALGPIAGTGMLQGRERLIAGFERTLGIKALSVGEVIAGIEKLGSCACSNESSCTVQYFTAVPGKLVPALREDGRFRLLAIEVPEAFEGANLNLRAELLSLKGEQRLARMKALLSSELALLMGVPAESLSLKRKIADLGLDSLLVMEFAAALEEKLELKIPLTLLDAGASLESLSEALSELIAKEGADCSSCLQEAAASKTQTAAGDAEEIEILLRQHAVSLDPALLAEASSEVRNEHH